MRAMHRVWTLAILLGVSATSRAVVLDPRFGSQGASFLYVEDGSAAALAVQPDGKVIALSDTNSGPVILVRLTDRGRFDTTFGEGGTSTHFGSPDVYVASALSLQPDGKILVAGSVYGTQGTRMFVSRFLTNGDPDPSFGAGGLVVTEFPGLFAGASALALGADGKIVAAGYAGLLGSSDFAAARYDSDGTLDASFGTGGRVVVDAGGGTYVEGARAVVVEADGGIVLGGASDSSGGGFVLLGLLSDGSVDASFGTSGRVQPVLGRGPNATASHFSPTGRSSPPERARTLTARWSPFGSFGTALRTRRSARRASRRFARRAARKRLRSTPRAVWYSPDHRSSWLA